MAPRADPESGLPCPVPVRSGRSWSAELPRPGRGTGMPLHPGGPPGACAGRIAPPGHALGAGGGDPVHPVGPSSGAASGGAVAGILRLFYDASSESRPAA